MRPKRSPLIQEGFEIPRTIVVEWSDSIGLEILKEKTEEVSISLEKDYVDDSSKSILAEIQEADVEISSSESDHGP